MADLTPATIVSVLSDIGRKLDQQAVEVEELDRIHVEQKAAYRRAFAASFLSAEGAMDARRYKAELETADLYKEVEMSEQVLRAAKESLRVLRDRLEIGRSLGAVMRLEYGSS